MRSMVTGVAQMFRFYTKNTLAHGRDQLHFVCFAECSSSIHRTLKSWMLHVAPRSPPPAGTRHKSHTTPHFRHSALLPLVSVHGLIVRCWPDSRGQSGSFVWMAAPSLITAVPAVQLPIAHMDLLWLHELRAPGPVYCIIFQTVVFRSEISHTVVRSAHAISPVH